VRLSGLADQRLVAVSAAEAADAPPHRVQDERKTRADEVDATADQLTRSGRRVGRGGFNARSVVALSAGAAESRAALAADEPALADVLAYLAGAAPSGGDNGGTRAEDGGALFRDMNSGTTRTRAQGVIGCLRADSR
jgi:hypothetical protein